MFVRQFYVESLGHYSYLIGSLDAGVGFAVDPKRDIADYVDAAGAMGLRITHILETHLHNDYVSGARRLRRPPARPSGTARRPAWPTRTSRYTRATSLALRRAGGARAGNAGPHARAPGLRAVRHRPEPRGPGPAPQRRRSAGRLGRPARLCWGPSWAARWRRSFTTASTTRSCAWATPRRCCRRTARGRPAARPSRPRAPRRWATRRPPIRTCRRKTRKRLSPPCCTGSPRCRRTTGACGPPISKARA